MDGVDWDDECGILVLRKYYALRHEAEDTVLESKCLCSDTLFSVYALQDKRTPERHLHNLHQRQRVVPPLATDCNERLTYYVNHNIEWIVRPRHEDAPDGFKWAGRFKKASSTDYRLELSLKAEQHLETLAARANAEAQQGQTPTLAELGGVPGDERNFMGSGLYSIQYQHCDEDDHGIIFATWAVLGGSDTLMIGDDLTQHPLGMTIKLIYEESGRRWCWWVVNGKATRLGEYVVIVNSDTVVPEDCLRDAAGDERLVPMAKWRPLWGTTHLWWKAIQDTVFISPVDSKEKIWSKTNVLEGFDMALCLLLHGYIICWATYSNGGFKEGAAHNYFPSILQIISD
ncbi:hypothetical protein DFH08DRAFT_946658 [Mycena albidolilacea]|uniref:Uncharacterized protein n=1 Tax=Mycena albidolilacea TaxID=1033008 RepID=A0AAD7ATF7_9AGAR|nr:hypothetical protein DFH08DRAFT_946658 [Mycena albidolilacea]